GTTAASPRSPSRGGRPRSRLLPPLSRPPSPQAAPTRPIRFVIPFPPGGPFDTVGRPLAEKMKPLLGTMVVENIGGGGGSLGVAAGAAGPPRGYTPGVGGPIPPIHPALP